MTHASALRTLPTDTTRILALAARVLDRSGVIEILEAEPNTRSPRTGRPTALGQYTTRGVLCVFFEHMFAGRPMSWADFTRSLWFRYSDEQMNLIGLCDLRSAERLRAMRPHLDSERGTVSGEARKRAARTFTSETMRLNQFCQRAFEPIDSTPIRGTRNKRKRPTRGEVRAARKNPEVKAKNAKLHEVMNRIVQATVLVMNDDRYPGSTLHTGLLSGHLGDLAIDEHHVSVGVGKAQGGQENADAPANMIAEWHCHMRRFKAAVAMGLTNATAVSRPEGPQVPPVTLGMALHEPTAGSLEGALTAIDAIGTAPGSGLRPPSPSRQDQYVTTDQGYSNLVGFNKALNTRRYSAIMTYRKTDTVLSDIVSIDEGTGRRRPTGLLFFQGRVLCPGVGRDTLIDKQTGRARRFEAPAQWTGLELHAHAQEERRLKAALMRTEGRPLIRPDRPRGRQPNSAPTPKDKITVRLKCPAAEGLVRCPILHGFEIPPGMEDKPQMQHAPWKLPVDERPICCQKREVTVELTEEQFKHWQPRMAGTWDHADLYSAARARNEASNSRLISANFGGNLRHGTIAFWRDAPVGIAVAMSVAVMNVHVIERWDEVLADPSDPQGGKGRPPREAAAERRRQRAEIIATYLANKNAGRSRGQSAA